MGRLADDGRGDGQDGHQAQQGGDFCFFGSISDADQNFIFGNDGDGCLFAPGFYIQQERSGLVIAAQVVDQNVGINDIFHGLSGSFESLVPGATQAILIEDSGRESFLQDAGGCFDDVFVTSGRSALQRTHQPFNGFDLSFQRVNAIQQLGCGHLIPPGKNITLSPIFVKNYAFSGYAFNCFPNMGFVVK